MRSTFKLATLDEPVLGDSREAGVDTSRLRPSVLRKLLMVAFHFPPFSESSGTQRTLRFAQYLPEFGWSPIILTVWPRAYHVTSAASLSQIPDGCQIERVPCLDVSRHLSWRNRYPGRLAIPDRWASWSLLGPRRGRALCRSHRVAAVWSTFPIATAHAVASAIVERNGLPWVADFRDPIVQEGWPESTRRRAAYARIEADAADRADALVYTTPSALAACERRYTARHHRRFELIENAYDESTFAAAATPPEPDGLRSGHGKPIVLLHSGMVYPAERDPTALLEAVARLRDKGLLRAGDLIMRFRAPLYEANLRELVQRFDVGSFVEIVPPLPYGEAISEMLDSDALLLLQCNNCNEQIPAKLYEYLRAGRPILGLADPVGDTGSKLSQLGYPFVVPLESSEAIERTLPAFLESIRRGSGYTLPSRLARQHSRRERARQLAGLLDDVCRLRSSA
jgi:glycosyltransferase involved in cell wall biosynthesis